MSPPHRRDSDESTPTDELMSPQEQARKIRQMHRALIGDPLDKNSPGLVTMYTELHRDYYGDEDTKRTGTKEMVLSMWEMRLKVIGGVAVVSVVSSIGAWLLQKYVFK